LFEGWIANLLRTYGDHRGLFDEWYYWSPAEARRTEVDFLLGRAGECWRSRRNRRGRGRGRFARPTGDSGPPRHRPPHRRVRCAAQPRHLRRGRDLAGAATSRSPCHRSPLASGNEVTLWQSDRAGLFQSGAGLADGNFTGRLSHAYSSAGSSKPCVVRRFHGACSPGASYEDLIALPEHMVGEIVDGELYASPRRPRRTRLPPPDRSDLFGASTARQTALTRPAAGGFSLSRSCTSVPT